MSEDPGGRSGARQRTGLVRALCRHLEEVAIGRDEVDAADAELTKALKSVEKAADIVKGVSKFLGVVDKAIDLAKTLAPLAAGL